MSETLEGLRHQIGVAGQLHSIVRTMKALAAANIGQYENAVQSLAAYYETVVLSLAACAAELKGNISQSGNAGPSMLPAGVIIFGSDQGMVGLFNSQIGEYAGEKLQNMGERIPAWVVGQRVTADLALNRFDVVGRYATPASVETITPLVNDLLPAVERYRQDKALPAVYVIHHCPAGRSGYTPVMQRLLPLADIYVEEWAKKRWPTRQRPGIIGGGARAWTVLLREYLFVLLFKACAESLASENASRLAAMEHAEKSIGRLSEQLVMNYHRLRQGVIDDELFDIISGSEAAKGGA